MRASQQTFKDTGINLKSMPLGEADRLMTILTQGRGLIRAVAKGARKQPSKMGGRMELFIVNDLILASGSGSLLRITQADTVQRFSRLSRSLAQLTAAQYLAEAVLTLSVADHPQEEMFLILLEHLERLEQGDPTLALPRLAQGLYHLLAINGIAPQMQQCLSCHVSLHADPDRDVALSYELGGGLCDPCRSAQSLGQSGGSRSPKIALISGSVLSLLQALSAANLPEPLLMTGSPSWLRVEYLLRRILEHHTGREIRSAELLDAAIGQGSQEQTELNNVALDP